MKLASNGSRWLTNFNTIFMKKISIIAPIVLLIGFEILFLFPKIYILIVLIAALLIISIVSLLILMGDKIREHWPIAVHIIFLILSGFLFSLLLSQAVLYQLFLIMMFFLYWFVLKTLFQFLYQPRLYCPHSLENASIWLTFLIVFFCAAELNALSVFYNISVWLTILPFFVFSLWSYFYLFWINDIKFERRIEILVIFSLILTEFYFVLNFLPINFHLIGLLLAGFYIIIFKLWQKSQKLTSPMAVSSLRK